MIGFFTVQHSQGADSFVGFSAKLTALSALPYHNKTHLLKEHEPFIKNPSEIFAALFSFKLYPPAMILISFPPDWQ